MIKGLFETHLHVSNLEDSMRFYGDVLELELAYQQPARRVAFYWIGAPGQAMLGLWEKPADTIQRLHFAFEVTIDDMHSASDYLKSKGIEPRNFFNDGDQPQVFGWMPAVALYFSDPDGHSLEFIAMLPDDPHPEVGVVDWDLWEARARV